MNRHDHEQGGDRRRLPRRRFLQAILGLLGGLALPARARRDRSFGRAALREADFYRTKEANGRRYYETTRSVSSSPSPASGRAGVRETGRVN